MDSPRCELFRSAEEALYAGVSRVGLRPGDHVLVPTHTSGTATGALVRAGLSVVPYGTTPELAPDPDELAALVTPRSRALMLIHVLGFPQDAAAWRQWCDDRGLLLIEDAAQAWSATVEGQPIGCYGDLTIFCPSEALPIPSISASVTRGPTGVAPAEAGMAHHGVARRLAVLLLRRLTQDPAPARRENYRLLLEQLADVVPEPFDVLPEGASPLAFPVAAPDTAALMERLTSLGVESADLLPRPHPSVAREETSAAAARLGATVVVPVHQALTAQDLDCIVDAVRPSRRGDEELHVEHVDHFETLRDEWTELALGTRNVFASWEWNRTWWEHFGNGRPLALTTLRDARGALRGILPLYLWAERPLRIARFLGHVAGDQLQPVCAPADRAGVSRSIRALLHERRWDLVMGDRLPAPDAWGRRIGGRVVRRESSPVLFLHGTWEESTRAWSARFRSQLRRLERRMRADHDVRIRTVEAPEELEAGLDTFFHLHRARWTEGTKFEERESFHRGFARRAFHNGWLRLQFMEADGVPVAGVLNFRYCGVEFGYQSGWDPQYAEHSVGTLQLLEAIRSAHADGIREYRLLRGGESYKYRFADADTFLETVVVPGSSVSGAAAAAAVSLAGRARSRYLRARGTPHA